MAENPLRMLQEHGQSVWLDYIRRLDLVSGQFQRLVDEDGVSGVTANPTIFEKAIAGSSDYDEAIKALVEEGKDPYEIYVALGTDDIRTVADMIRPRYEESRALDGYACIEVTPALAYDSAGTVAEAHRFVELVGRPNVMPKVPATREGLEAIERLTYEGVCVNVTLIFSIQRYEEVMEAYIRGLERRRHEGKPIDRITSVASFFVSRVDTAVDRLLQKRIDESKDAAVRAECEALLGKAAIANAKLAYERFKAVFHGERFAELARHGALVQRPLWASTGTKNPKYSDVLYIEELIGPQTVNTMPPATMNAFRDHGRVRGNTLEEDVAGAQETMRRLAALGIDMTAVTQQLEDEGVKLFAQSFDQLIECIAGKREALLRERQEVAANLEPFRPEIDAALTQLGERHFVEKLWKKDASRWSPDPDTQQAIRDRLGWLTIVDTMDEHTAELESFADTVRAAGIEQVVLLGMGGSSLAAEVIAGVFDSKETYPQLRALDTTDPDAIIALEQALDLTRTLFLVASKSGTTQETLALYRYFWARVEERVGTRAGDHFIAITDPGTPLATLAKEHGFRRLFLNPPDIGGRYSALSYFGLVPAALIGAPIRDLLDRARGMVERCAACVPVAENPGVWLGALLATLAVQGRDKVTLVTSPTIAAFADWVEQLLAESTGKDGKGLIPVVREPLGNPSVYGDDRFFVCLSLQGDAETELTRRVDALEAAGKPLIRLSLGEKTDLGAEFFRWGLATAIAGALLGINPFDEPNVQESKENTARLLTEFVSQGGLSEPAAAFVEGEITVFADGEIQSLVETLRQMLVPMVPGDYVALMAYSERTPVYEEALQAVRRLVRDRLRPATTLGFGPRFLHSTGQLHKGGPAKGRFIQITADDAVDMVIPGESYGFGVLKRAQALGDLQALQRRGRPVVRLHLPAQPEAALRRLTEAFTEAVSAAAPGGVVST